MIDNILKALKEAGYSIQITVEDEKPVKVQAIGTDRTLHETTGSSLLVSLDKMQENLLCSSNN
ncbi:hypothetical protein [Guptibacillus spartinae]|uniref:hypothetical protein n=1 Tax=Guptibacillus spartinae TaxID=3025679 RepID=UPI0023600F22|nr:hypothetical protein [Pseudalkalibacillus spartinae]